MIDLNALRRREDGNILFMILIAVALFAALSYAVTQSSRGGSKDASSEIASLAAAQIVQYASAVEQAVTRVRVIGGCSETEISFANDIVSGYEHSPVQPDRCRVFHPDGGGAVWMTPQAEWFDPTKSGPYNDLFHFAMGNAIGNVGTTAGAPGDYTELLIRLYDIKDDLCEEVNRRFDIPGIPNNDIQFAAYGAPFVGTYTGGGSIAIHGAPELTGHHTGCFYSTSGGFNHNVLYHVLIAR